MIRWQDACCFGLLVAVASACGGTDNGRPSAEVKDVVAVDTGSKPVLCSVEDGYEFKTIEDFEKGAVTGGWYFNNDLCDKCQKVIDRVKELNNIINATKSSVFSEYSTTPVYPDKYGCSDWRLLRKDGELEADYQARIAPVLEPYQGELELRTMQLTEGDPDNNVPKNCQAVCNASQTPNAYLKPLDASVIEFRTDGRHLEKQPRCDSHYAMHVQGGPFETWGGSFAVQLGQPGLDATGWDGISFWVRVGPSSRHPLRIEISDWQNDDKQMMYVDRETDVLGPVTREGLIKRDSENKVIADYFDVPDDDEAWCKTKLFVCNPDSVREDKNGCDRYGANRSMSGDWQFFAIDFSEFRQSGWGMTVTTPPMDPNGEPSEIDKSQLRSLNFLWTTGLWDVWVDDIALFRRKQ